LLCARFPALELVRFTNSGTDANLMALALGLHITGRSEILVFKGGYHGGVLAFGGGEPSPVTVPHAFVLGDYNDVEGTRELIRTHTLAAILVEPMLGSGGCTPGTPEFLSALREEATASGALLIFDEVMTSRLPRPAVPPDLMTVGKYLAGGMSFGAFGGRAELMGAYDPTRPDALFHAGTFNNNVVSMSAGIAGLTHVLTDERLAALNTRGDRLRERLNRTVPTTGLGSLMTIHPESEERKRLLFFELLDRGFWVASRLMLALNLEITDEICDSFAGAVESILC
jgi:glutamate-1-semialdehyde 2,1-aminomutase